MGLTEEQKLRMEQNRLRAIEKRKSGAASGHTISNESFQSVVKKPKTESFYGSASRKKISGHCVLISKDRFKVQIGYHSELIASFKMLKTAQYNAKDRLWTFEINEHDELMKKVRSLQPEVTVQPLPSWIIRTFRSQSSSIVREDKDLSRIDPHLLGCLLPFQREGVTFGLKRDGRVLIADDMGLGKTVQALAIADYYSSEWPLLIVTPSSVKFSWKAAIRKWIPSIAEEDVRVIESGKEPIEKELYRIIIISYDLLSKRTKEIISMNIQVMIWDESHFLKNHKSVRCQSAVQVGKSSKRVILLSGTPALSRPIELFSQIAMVDPRLFAYPSEYGMRYCDGRKVTIGKGASHFDFSGTSNMEEFNILITERCMIRRLKSQVLSQLPTKQRQMIILDPSSVGKKDMRDKANLMAKASLDGNEKRGILLEWFNSTAIAKEKAVLEYIKDLLEGDKKFIVFAHHQSMMRAIESLLTKEKVKFITIEGKTQSDSRKALVDRFQTSDACRVAILSITSANSGITLTAASMVVFAELFWNPGILTQAEDRVHRIGQTDSVTIHYLVAKGTADDKLWPMIQRKLDVLNEAGLSKDNFSDANTTTHLSSSNKITEYFSSSFAEEDLELLVFGDDDFMSEN